jgi:deoxyribonuclease-2
MNARNNLEGRKVDWWFAYKFPQNTGPQKNSTGFEFLYSDSDKKGETALSKVTLDHESSALSNTLKQIFGKDPDSVYILWNDEIPPSKENPKPENDKLKGHSKGALGFSTKTNTGFYLLHSTPRFPQVGKMVLPENERKYGQTFLCITLNGRKELNDIAEILHAQHQVQVYASKLEGVKEDEAFHQLARGDKAKPMKTPSVYNFKSQSGYEFILFGKNKRWSESLGDKESAKDLWEDLVAPHLQCNLSVETWRRGLVFADRDAFSNEITKDAIDLDFSSLGLKGYQWPFTKDHAKWGVSDSAHKPYVIVADINRQESQSKRGGGALAFKMPELWTVLRNAEIPEKDISDTIHKDHT